MCRPSSDCLNNPGFGVRATIESYWNSPHGSAAADREYTGPGDSFLGRADPARDTCRPEQTCAPCHGLAPIAAQFAFSKHPAAAKSEQPGTAHSVAADERPRRCV